MLEVSFYLFCAVVLAVLFVRELWPLHRASRDYKRDLKAMRDHDAIFVELRAEEIDALRAAGVRFPRPRLFAEPSSFYIILNRAELRRFYDDVMLHARSVIGDAARLKKPALDGAAFFLGALGARLAAMLLGCGETPRNGKVDRPATAGR